MPDPDAVAMLARRAGGVSYKFNGTSRLGKEPGFVTRSDALKMWQSGHRWVPLDYTARGNSAPAVSQSKTRSCRGCSPQLLCAHRTVGDGRHYCAPVSVTNSTS
jgi:hypothetical protein